VRPGGVRAAAVATGPHGFCHLHVHGRPAALQHGDGPPGVLELPVDLVAFAGLDVQRTLHLLHL